MAALELVKLYTQLKKEKEKAGIASANVAELLVAITRVSRNLLSACEVVGLTSEVPEKEQLSAPANCRKLVHRWRSRERFAGRS